MQFHRIGEACRAVGWLIALCASATVSAVELRLDPYRLYQGAGAALGGGDGPLAIGLALDIPARDTWSWGPDYLAYAEDAGQVQRIGIQATHLTAETSGVYYGGGLQWLGVIAASGAEQAGVCQPALPLYLTGRWGYRWQVSSIVNIQFGMQAGAGQITLRQAERCAETGEELEAGPVQTFVDPRLDLSVGFRL